MIHLVVNYLKSIHFNEHFVIFLSACFWSEQDYQLARWAWKKWRYHRMTSLRVGLTTSFFSSVLSCNLFYYYLTYNFFRDNGFTHSP
jgi:hypothetical protein